VPTGIAILLVIYSVMPGDCFWFALIKAQFPFCLSFNLL